MTCWERSWLCVLSYGRSVSATGASHGRALVVYTLLRALLFGAVWAVVWFLTPLDAVWSAMAALLISGAISLVLLDRQRGRVGVAAGGFFSRMNDRIDAATRAEDFDDPDPASSAPAEASGQGDEQAQQESVDEQQGPGALEGGDQGGSASGTQDDPER